MPQRTRKKSVSNAIENLYDRIEEHDQSINIGFAWKAIPFGLLAAALLLTGVRNIFKMNADVNNAIMLIALSLLIIIVIYLLWVNSMWKQAFVYMT